jgi:uncharacterized protein (DUF169 family)
MTRDAATAAQELTDRLGLGTPPLGIAFTDRVPEGVPRHDAPMAAPAADGRTGRVPAGCVFWIQAARQTFATVPEDHGNCSVGSYTHGLIDLATAAGKDDVGALLESGWVDQATVQQIPAVAERPAAIVYGPLREAPVAPDLVFLRVNGKQAMLLKDAWPQLRVEGKPQCHIVPIAKEQGAVAMSVGCMLSRVRTGMANSEMTVAIPAGQLDALLDALATAQPADRAVAQYAAQDAKRFAEG